MQGLQLQSLVKPDATLEISLQQIVVPDPGPDDVVVEVQATPLNPSDLALLFGFADMTTAKNTGTDEAPVITASIPDSAMGMVAERVGQSLAVGNEGAGIVVAAGESDAAQALVGKTVGMIGGEMYAQYRCLNIYQCMELQEGTTAAQGASSFVNPMTALGMVETMRTENHTALVHTAAASNLGQMLNKLCANEDIGLVNIVRKPEQEAILQQLGANYICNSSDENFKDKLTALLVETGATLAFDATGGGSLGNDILFCMEAAACQQMTGYSAYGSDVHKQLYIYGGLDRSATVLHRNFGFSWGVGGWLLTPFLQKIGLEKMLELRSKVAAEITTTFASHYTREVSLQAALSVDAIAVYSLQTTGEKYLINPSL